MNDSFPPSANRVSEAVNELLKVPPPSTDKAALGFNAILRKYRKMEEALKLTRSVVSGYERPSERHLKIIDEALAYDPLNQ